MSLEIKKLLKENKKKYKLHQGELIWINPQWDSKEFFDYVKSIPSNPQLGIAIDEGNPKNKFFRVLTNEKLGIKTDILIKNFILRRKYDFFRFRFLESKAVRSMNMALAINHTGVKTPEPIAIIEKRDKFRKIIYSYYICQYVESKYHFLGIMRDKNSPLREKVKDFLAEAGKDLRKMHNGGIVHNDFHPGNILINDKNEFFYIDLNRGRIKKELSLKERIADLIRFDLTEEEEKAFVSNYESVETEKWLEYMRNGRSKRNRIRAFREWTKKFSRR